jgi:two-component sensor histidine kinase
MDENKDPVKKNVKDEEYRHIMEENIRRREVQHRTKNAIVHLLQSIAIPAKFS